jgi:hypothetical protein
MDEMRITYMLTVNLKAIGNLIWERDVKMDLREIRCEVVAWFHLAQDVASWRTPVNTVMNIRVP